MPSQVALTEDAERDLEDIVTYISQHDSPRKAVHVLNRILGAADSLALEPMRGSTPKELVAIGGHEYRQIFFKPYRLIYRIMEKQVVIYLIADGRRDMQTLLARRLLGA